MSYKHILVAVDLSQSSEQVINKAVSLAKDSDAKLSLIFVDVENLSNIAMANIEVSTLPTLEEREATLQSELQLLADKTDYPIASATVVVGKLTNKLQSVINDNDVDLLVCGHHHDLWSRLFSSVNKLVNSMVTDLLVVYLKQ